MKRIIILSILAWSASIGFLHAQLPAVILKTIDGQSVKTDTLSNNGKPFIIDFFAFKIVLNHHAYRNLVSFSVTFNLLI